LSLGLIFSLPNKFLSISAVLRYWLHTMKITSQKKGLKKELGKPCNIRNSILPKGNTFIAPVNPSGVRFEDF
jgi:hypothetical protein